MADVSKADVREAKQMARELLEVIKSHKKEDFTEQISLGATALTIAMLEIILVTSMGDQQKQDEMAICSFDALVKLLDDYRANLAKS